MLQVLPIPSQPVIHPRTGLYSTQPCNPKDKDEGKSKEGITDVEIAGKNPKSSRVEGPYTGFQAGYCTIDITAQ